MLEFLRKLPDPIKDLDDLIAVLSHGLGRRLIWTYGSTWNGARVEKLLNTYGIRTYARKYAYKDGDFWGLRVQAKQGDWAEYIALGAGVPLIGKDLDRRDHDLPASSWGVPSRPVGMFGWLTRAADPIRADRRRPGRKAKRRRRGGA